jgi:CRISPR type III-B/RAMP module-associated protein Cmr5
MVGGQTGPQSGKGLSSLGGTERDRAEGAWKIAKERSKEHWFKQYRNLVKGSASLVMSNGLISALAYYNTRSGATNATKEAAKKLAEDIASFALPGTSDAANALDKLVKLKSRHYMLATNEVLANLRWLRQLVDAVGD